MKQLPFLFLFIGVLHVSFNSPTHYRSKKASPAFPFTTNEFIDFSLFTEIPCSGDIVSLEGKLHVLSHVTINGSKIVVKTHYQPQGITGVGLSGDKYQGVGVTQDISTGSLVGSQFTFTAINNFRIIGQRPGNNYLIHSVLHVTVNANGEVTTIVDKFSFDCK